MAIYGIIAEYNPFHNGHRYQLDKIRERDPNAQIVVVMSGNLMQRGSLPILDKWQRAGLAVKNGVDLVFELPTVFAARSAQYFAEGGVRLLHSLQVADYLAFGTEADNPGDLMDIADLMALPDFDLKLKAEIKKGLSYAAAVSSVIGASADNAAALIKTPNNILALEYLKALKKIASDLKPYAIKRTVALHNATSLSGSISSATSIRACLARNDILPVKASVPHEVYELLEKKHQAGDFPIPNNLFRSFMSTVYTKSSSALKNTYGINEGLENRLIDALSTANSFEDFFGNLSTRRYPLSRCRRLVSYILLNLDKSFMAEMTAKGPLYARVLAFNDKGRSLLRQINQASKLPIITKVSQALNSGQRLNHELNDLQKMLNIDLLATDIYNLSFNTIKNIGEDFRHSPIYIAKR